MSINVGSNFINDDVLAKILELYLGQILRGLTEAKVYGTQIFFIRLSKDIEYATASISCFNVCYKRHIASLREKYWRRKQ
jgi:predicted metalloenzyme YecM